MSSAEVIMGFAPGAVGGFFNVFVGHPLDLVKTRQQVGGASIAATANASYRTNTATLQHGSTKTMLRSIFAQQGVTGLYAGVSAPLLAVVPAFAIVFSTNDCVKNMLADRGNASQLSTSQFAIAGGISGVPLAIVLGPLERIKCEFQVHGASKYSNSIRACAHETYKQGTLFRGTALTMARDVPGNAVYFASYEVLRRMFCQLQGIDSPSMAATVLAGGLAGMANWTIALPMDVIKSRFQVGAYSSCWQVVTDLIRHEGPSALFRGLSPALLRAFPANAACFLGAETVRTMLTKADR
ncbi:hypothetical protein MPSEU_001003000 [Mayamaea pseudoterrestris]|nr:hypothetical protein MPSEU_001003000 [Mayamaea pseudoterrestris]